MRLIKVRILVEMALVVALVITGLGWYWSDGDAGSGPPWGRDAPSRFDSCVVDERGYLVLAFSHGVGDEVSPSVDFRSGEVIVSLARKVTDEPSIAIALNSTFRVEMYGPTEPLTVSYPDGTTLDCPLDRSGPDSRE